MLQRLAKDHAGVAGQSLPGAEPEARPSAVGRGRDGCLPIERTDLDPCRSGRSEFIRAAFAGLSSVGQDLLPRRDKGRAALRRWPLQRHRVGAGDRIPPECLYRITPFGACRFPGDVVSCGQNQQGSRLSTVCR